MNKLFSFIVLFLTVSVFCPDINRAEKPLPPLTVKIMPVTGIASDQIKPGDIVDFKIAAVSSIDTEEMRIDVRFTGGAKLVSGDTSWSGPVKKNEEKDILLTVRAPEGGQGRITARASLPPSNNTRFSAEAFYSLGSEPEEKQTEKPVKKKSSKGRDIIEYQ